MLNKKSMCSNQAGQLSILHMHTSNVLHGDILAREELCCICSYAATAASERVDDVRFMEGLVIGSAVFEYTLIHSI